ncbi:MAG: GIY-YIG nuclease family protein [Microgenomates group bacterium]|jgi:putative endonuclease
MWFVYLLLCNQKTFYVGITNDLGKRFTQHKNKESIHTKQFSDIQIAYCEEYKTKYEAAARERQLKGWSHAKKQMLIDKTIYDPHCTEIDEVSRES